jgi:hypothetical protein
VGYSIHHIQHHHIQQRAGCWISPLSRFSHPGSCLAVVIGLAFVRIELLLDNGLRFIGLPSGLCRELGIAEFTNSEYRNVPDSLYDPEVAFGQGSCFLLNTIH